MNAFIQIMIFACGAGSIYLLNRHDKYSKYGAIIGMIGQPFWYISTWETASWGIFFANFIYTYSYAIGIYNFWLKK